MIDFLHWKQEIAPEALMKAAMARFGQRRFTPKGEESK